MAERLLLLAQRAPSGFNLQPWSVVLVRSEEARRKLAGAMLGSNSRKVTEAPATAVFCADLEPASLLPELAAAYRARGVSENALRTLEFNVEFLLGGGRGRRGTGAGASEETGPTALGTPADRIASLLSSAVSVLQPTPALNSAEAWGFKNTALAAQTYMLAASAHGVGTCPMEGFDIERLRDALSLPRRYSVPLVVATGFAHAEEEAAIERDVEAAMKEIGLKGASGSASGPGNGDVEGRDTVTATAADNAPFDNVGGGSAHGGKGARSHRFDAAAVFHLDEWGTPLPLAS